MVNGIVMIELGMRRASAVGVWGALWDARILTRNHAPVVNP